MPLDVLVISSRADIGGGPEHILTLLLHATDIRFHVACPADAPYWKRFQAIVGTHRMLELPHRRFSLRSLIALMIYVRKNKIDVIHSHGKGAGVFSRPTAVLAGRPCVHTFHGLHTGSYGPFFAGFYLLYERVFGHVTALTISVSPGEAAQLAAAHIGNRGKAVVIPNGVSASAEQGKRNLETSSLIEVVSALRFDFQKHPELIIEIANELKILGQLDRFHFRVLGGGDGVARFKDLVINSDLTQHISIEGPVDACRPYFRRSTIYLSTSRWEGLSIALLEAMAEGTPAVASRVIGNEDIITHARHGYLFDKNDAGQAAAFLVSLASDSKSWSEMSLAAQQTVTTRFSAAEMASKTVECYRRVAA